MITEDENEDIFNNIKCELEDNYLPVPRHIKNNELTIFD